MARRETVHVGARFGRLVVTAEPLPGRRPLVPVRCDCGTQKAVRLDSLGTRSISCGCARLAAITKHGLTRAPEHKVWGSMIQRCTNPRSQGWRNYGARGIRVHPEWLADFQAFYRDLGPRPTPRHSLDRIDVNGNYEPGNCRWATWSQQNANQRRRSVCGRGHRIEGDNEYVFPSGKRACRACRREQGRRRYLRLKAQKGA